MRNNYNVPEAIAIINGKYNNSTIIGMVKFYQKQNCVLVVADINGLPHTETGFYGFHIHEGISCGGMNFANSKSHFNPVGTQHPKHAGDLPPLMLCKNRAYLSVLTDRFSIKDIINRTVIIHSMPDDFTTQPSGNAGEKIACGVIRKNKP